MSGAVRGAAVRRAVRDDVRGVVRGAVRVASGMGVALRGAAVRIAAMPR